MTAPRRPVVFIFHESPRYDLVVECEGRPHRIAKLRFARDGSIYVICPTFPDTRGFVGIAKIPIGHGPTANNLAEFGLITTHLVKYAHHVDGEAHFSQGGKIKTLVRRRSTPLSELSGHLCSIVAKPVSDFPAPKGKDPQLTFRNHESERVEVAVMRFRRSDIETEDHTSGNVTALAMADGTVRNGVFAAPPSDYALSEFFVFIHLTPNTASSEGRCLMLLGGFDPPAISLDRTKESEYLVFMYPNVEHDALAKSMQSIDLEPPGLR